MHRKKPAAVLRWYQSLRVARAWLWVLQALCSEVWTTWSTFPSRIMEVENGFLQDCCLDNSAMFISFPLPWSWEEECQRKDALKRGFQYLHSLWAIYSRISSHILHMIPHTDPRPCGVRRTLLGAWCHWASRSQSTQSFGLQWQCSFKQFWSWVFDRVSWFIADAYFLREFEL